MSPTALPPTGTTLRRLALERVSRETQALQSLRFRLVSGNVGAISMPGRQCSEPNRDQEGAWDSAALVVLKCWTEL